MKTFMAKAAEIERKWYLIDADGLPLGRLAAEVSKILIGKGKPEFTPGVDTGDYVIVTNAEKVLVTGKKAAQKQYFRHSGYPGGVKLTNFNTMIQKNPERVIELAVKGMLPKNSLGRAMFKKLRVYKGENHGHEAQQPQVLDLKL